MPLTTSTPAATADTNPVAILLRVIVVPIVFIVGLTGPDR